MIEGTTHGYRRDRVALGGVNDGDDCVGSITKPQEGAAREGLNIIDVWNESHCVAAVQVGECVTDRASYLGSESDCRMSCSSG